MAQRKRKPSRTSSFTLFVESLPSEVVLKADGPKKVKTQVCCECGIKLKQSFVCQECGLVQYFRKYYYL